MRGLSKKAQARYDRLVTDNLDKIEPQLILQTDGLVLPKALQITVLAPLNLFPVTHDVILKFLASGRLADQIAGAGNLSSALPSETELRVLSTVEICAALRGPVLHEAIARLGQIAHHDVRINGPRLEDIFEQGKLSFQEGHSKQDLPEDTDEQLWVTYFQNIFNPARLKVKAM